VLAFVIACSAFASVARGADEWKPVEGRLMTRWAKDVGPEKAWPEYPRPQLVRKDWQNLNGLWEYAIRPGGEEERPERYDGKILVPFCVESALSGVGKAVQPEEALWYQRAFRLPGEWKGKRVLLHFGAVDWSADAWVNGRHVGGHQGGYDAFTFDVTDALAWGGEEKLVVKVTDSTDKGWQPRGKQVLKPHGIWYTAVTGIWQTVWLEPVGERYIRSLKIMPDVDRSSVEIEVDAEGGGPVRAVVRDEGQTVVEGAGEAGKRISLAIAKPKLWSPDSPHLYDVSVALVDGKQTVDAVESYFGMRKIAVGERDEKMRLLLNEEALFQLGPLDQGWWPDGLYTAPTDEALRYDLETLKSLGMNMLRKHVKVEPERLYHHCDRLGLLVWQDMPSGDRYIGGKDADIQRTPESAAGFERELKAMIESRWNHPSIVMWVLYNEGWGQWDTARMTGWIKEHDPSRLVDSASGWTDRGVGDVVDVHSYPAPDMRPPEERRASVLGEYGGLGWPVNKHLWQDQKNWGYSEYGSRTDLQKSYLNLVQQLRPMIGQGLSAAVYTQTSDVEGEVNGLMTYDRAVLKMDAKALSAAHRRLYLPPPEIKEVVPTSAKTPQEWRYTVAMPGEEWMKPKFDDSSWKPGKGMFGREGTPGVKVGTAWTSGDIWLRRGFELAEAPQGELVLAVYHDEDAEVYINGVMAGRFRDWTTRHITAELSEEARKALSKGKNTLAVHCHQTSGGQGIDVGLWLLVDREGAK
jgi:hypothetical protein